MNQLPPGIWNVGNKMYSICHDCQKIVCLNKFLLGTLHVCLTREEIAAKRKQQGRG